ncbi:MAG: 2-oxo acid dehydrogenase subunit E2, partial [Candidatus Latescibacteria bacterium]|nr:2-oxo acid dehydrogenase subunit E2 [Candidatus Latescibacterota bacterium]
TGPGGRIVKSDVEAFAQQSVASTASTVATSVPSTTQPQGTQGQGGKMEKSRSALSGIRKITAARLAESASTIPHFYVSMEIDMTRAVTLRQELNEYGESHGLSKVSVNDMIIRATALALKESSAVNASLIGDTIVRYADVNVGFAVALDDGLVVPVVTASDQKSVYDIAGATKALDAKAKSGGLSPDDYGHGTFTISNLGMFGVDQFTAIINPPEAAILAVGRVKETPAVIDGSITARSKMVLTLSADHRLIDGAVAARFLSQIRDLLEQPIGLLLT